MFFCFVITSMAQRREVKEMIEEEAKIVEDIDNSVSMDVNSIELFGYLLPAPNDLIAEDKNGLSFDTRKIAFIPPGAYTFGYRRITTVRGAPMGHQTTHGNVSVGFSYTPTSQAQSKLLPVDAVIEAGKYYTTEYEIIRTKGILKEDSITVFIVELTDPQQILKAQNSLEEERERIRKLNINYLQFQEQNPARLEGKWSSEIGLGLGKSLFTHISFEGKKIRYEQYSGKSNGGKIKRPVIAEGRLFYSENIIVFIPEKASINGKENNLSKSYIGKKLLWHYTIINDELHLDRGLSRMIQKSSAAMPGGYVGMLKRN